MGGFTIFGFSSLDFRQNILRALAFGERKDASLSGSHTEEAGYVASLPETDPQQARDDEPVDNDGCEGWESLQ